MTVMKKNIHISLPAIGEEEWVALREPLLSGWITQGPQVAKFEKKFAEFHLGQHALATTSCTTALHLALTALGIGPGDEVIVPAFTWVATANVVLYCGATPVLCDVDITTFNIKIEDIVSKITKKTRAIIPVHLFGLCADVDLIRDIVPEHVYILEDAACAAGAQYKDSFAGYLGDMGAFSFHPRKSITCGEGGMLTTNSHNLANLAEKLRNHGAEISEEARHLGPRPYVLPDFNYLGFNYRMTDIQAAVGLVQLSKLSDFITQRSVWAQFYDDKFNDIDWLRPQAKPSFITRHAYQAYVCYVDTAKAPMSRNEIMDYLKQKGIATRPGTHAIHMLNYYKDRYNFRSDDYPGAMLCDRNTMAIPLHNKMTSDDYEYVVQVIKEIS